MGVKGFRQVMDVDFAADLVASMGTKGDIAYADDMDRHYKSNGTTWALIPNQSEITAVARKAIVNGSIVNGVTPYLCKTTVNAGSATLWLTDNGTSTGNAVFSSIFPEGIAINAYGTGNNYQVYNVTVSADKKSITCNVNQMAGAILGLVNVTSAANGIDVRGIILGTLINP